jgi:hypothetical protein
MISIPVQKGQSSALDRMNFLPKPVRAIHLFIVILKVLSDFSVDEAATPCRSNKLVAQKADSCHWANAARHRLDGACPFCRCLNYFLHQS